MIDSDRLAALYISLQGSPGAFALEFALASSNDERLKIVRQSVDSITADHVQTRQLRQDRTEDELTIDIVSGLKNMGFNAWHDAQIGGHTDISFDGKGGFLWLCEAKKHGSYDWLLDGFVQLESYCPGIAGQNAADIIIFHYGRNSIQVMERWTDHLVAARPEVQIQPTTTDPHVRSSTHSHKGSGITLDFRHKIVPLYWEQMQDAKGRRS